LKSPLIYFFGALGGLLFGYNTGVISGSLHFLGENLKVTENSLEEGLITSIILVGAVIGAFVIGKLADSIGRKKSLFIAAVIFVVGSILSGFATSLALLLIARVVLGLAVGAVSALVPMYLSELAPASRRGSLAFLNQLMIVSGILIAYIVNYAFSSIGSVEWNVEWGWRIALSVAVFPALLMFIGVFTLPESPRFLVFVGDISGAKDVLLRMRPASAVDKEINDIRSALTARTGTFRDLFSKFCRPALLIAALLALFQQLMGINTLIYYAPKILEVAGLDADGQRLATVVIGIVNLVATIIAITIVDRINRRTLLTAGGIVMAISLIALAFVESSGFLTAEGNAAGLISTLILGIYMFAFGITWGGVMWIVLAEIFPLHVRGIGVGVASTVNWVANFAVTLSFPALLGHSATEADCFEQTCTATMLEGHPFWLYISMAVFSLLGVVVVRKFLFETRGKSLEEIETELQLKSMNWESK
jgi:sugar porter (SP) family MFS transporter